MSRKNKKSWGSPTPEYAALARIARWNVCQQIASQMFRSSLSDSELRQRAEVVFARNFGKLQANEILVLSKNNKGERKLTPSATAARPL